MHRAIKETTITTNCGSARRCLGPALEKLKGLGAQR
jgi:hypothetical protein